MVRSTALCIALFALSFCVGVRAEEAKHEDTLKKIIASMTEIGNLLEAAKDVDTAKETEPKLLEAVKAFKANDAEMRKLPEPPKELNDELQKKYEPLLNTAMAKMQKESERITKAPDIAKELAESMKLLGSN